MRRLFQELITVEVEGDPDIYDLLLEMRKLAGSRPDLKVQTAYHNVWIAVSWETDVEEVAKQLREKFPKAFGRILNAEY